MKQRHCTFHNQPLASKTTISAKKLLTNIVDIFSKSICRGYAKAVFRKENLSQTKKRRVTNKYCCVSHHYIFCHVN